MLFLGFLATFVIAFMLGQIVAKQHPLIEAQTEDEVRKAWAECCQLYLEAKRRVGVR